MTYDEWLKSVPEPITVDLLWKVEGYRLAMFAADLGWHDSTKLVRDKRTLDLSDQLRTALGSVGAKISEGHSRSSGRDRARFYEYALGSARESRGWYCHGRYVLGDPVAEHRITFLTQMVRLLLTMIPDQRAVTLREESPTYHLGPESLNFEPVRPDRKALARLLEAPLP